MSKPAKTGTEMLPKNKKKLHNISCLALGLQNDLKKLFLSRKRNEKKNIQTNEQSEQTKTIEIYVEVEKLSKIQTVKLYPFTIHDSVRCSVRDTVCV